MMYYNWIANVEGLYCKRPIQWLASSKILTPHPLTAQRVCTGGRGGGGSIVCKTPETALYSILCNYFVIATYCTAWLLWLVSIPPSSLHPDIPCLGLACLDVWFAPRCYLTPSSFYQSSPRSGGSNRRREKRIENWPGPDFVYSQTVTPGFWNDRIITTLWV
jgi:hypothetical protein